MNLDSLFGALIGGSFALCGQWLSSFLSRTAEHKRWTKAERARVFERIIEAIEESDTAAYQFLRDATSKNLQADAIEIGLTRAWIPATAAVRAARLYVTAAQGEEIRKLVRQLAVNTNEATQVGSTTHDGLERIKSMRETREKLNSVFEEILNRRRHK